MKIIILGGSGFLGKFLTNFLKYKNCDVKTCGRSKENNIVIKSYSRKNLIKIFEKKKFDVLINLCAITNVDLCEKKRGLAKKIHVTLIKNLTEIIKFNNPQCFFLNISTDQLYNKRGKSLESEIRLTNFYSKSKFKGEKYVIKNGGCVLRTNFFGISKNNKKKNLVDWIIYSLKNGENINVFDNIFFSPIYVKTLCSHIFKVLKKKPYGIFNLGSSDCISKADFAFYIAKKMRFKKKLLTKSKYNPKTFRARRPKYMCMNSNKFKKFFKIKLNTSYHEIDKMIGSET